jgi:hypothetical protein
MLVLQGLAWVGPALVYLHRSRADNHRVKWRSRGRMARETVGSNVGKDGMEKRS